MAKDPYKYYRVEAAELLDNLTKGVLELERGAPDKAMVASLLRLAHTLKGASQVVKQPAIAQAAHTVEDILTPYRETDTPVARDQAGAILQLLDQIGAKLAALSAPPPGNAAAAETPRAAEPIETVRVELEEMEGLLASLAEAGVDLTAIQNEAAALRRARELAGWIAQQGASGGRTRSISHELLSTLAVSERRIMAGVERAERELLQTRDRANRLRLLPAHAILPSLGRAAREAAGSLSKQVDFDMAGGEVRLDAQVLAVLRDVLLHLVRNAVAHGIEEEEQRRAAGKPRAGRIEIQVRRSGSHVIFACRDDGRGMDLAAIRRAAVKKGAVSEADAATLGLKEAINLILKGGLSTSELTRISGRGIGLDVVRDAVTRLRGEIRIETAAGQGTTVEISVPVSLTSVTALRVETAGTAAAIPLESVRQTLRLAAADIVDTGDGESIVYAGGAIPFLRLSEVLRRNAGAVNGHHERTAVIVAADSVLAALGVNRLLATGSLLVRSLPPLAAADSVLAGGSLDAEGNPLLVLNPETLIAAARFARRRTEPAARLAPEPILIIDDSLTSRMVEQSLLESAGHRVECAGSAEEAFEKAHQRRYSLFLVDVEMPGMDGYEFISRAREDPLLHEIPSILVTSRGSPSDRRRGQEVGARAYITKSEFDQAQFLETVRQLVA